MECYWCHKHFDTPRHYIRYDKKNFCDEDCLGEFLVDRAEDDMEVLWFDTAENMRICAEEDAQDDYF